ncbi:MAG: hypothetical protein N2645_22350 [Clostridia bacterium]|nr:hypothetical protein [Clostridia bacterium]
MFLEITNSFTDTDDDKNKKSSNPTPISINKPLIKSEGPLSMAFIESERPIGAIPKQTVMAVYTDNNRVYL